MAARKVLVRPFDYNEWVKNKHDLTVVTTAGELVTDIQSIHLPKNINKRQIIGVIDGEKIGTWMDNGVAVRSNGYPLRIVVGDAEMETVTINTVNTISTETEN